jgi:hypothetical protein
VAVPRPPACGGARARDLLLRLAFSAPRDRDGDGLADRPGGRGRHVRLLLEPRLGGLLDRDGRLTAHVTMRGGRGLALALLEAGLARVRERGFRHHGRYVAAESRARAAGLGMWGC